MQLNFASRFLTGPLMVVLGQATGMLAFATMAQVVTTGLILAALSVAMDLIVLPIVGNRIATVTDFVAVAAFLWIAGQVAMGARVAWAGAIGVALMVAASEWAMHRWLRIGERVR